MTAATAVTAAAAAGVSTATTAITAVQADGRREALAQAGEHERAGRLKEAQDCVDRFLIDNPDDAEGVHLSGVLAFRSGRPLDAVRLMERSVELGPTRPYFLRNLCEIYRHLGRYDEGLAAGEAAAKGDPSDPLCHANLAVLHYARREPDQSIAAANRALALDPTLPGAHFALAEAFLLKGDFERGWEEYEWRFRLKGIPRLMPTDGPPHWDGAPMPEKRLMLIADQGFGDCIQFCRFIPWVRSRCPEVVVACSREMQPIVRQVAGDAMLFDRWEDCPSCEAHAPLSGLPRLHGGGAAGIPATAPYLHADASLSATWKSRLDAMSTPGSRRIGIVWAGRPTHNNDANRSMSLKTLAPLSDLTSVTLVSLQKGEALGQVGEYFGRAPLVNVGPLLATFSDTMAVIAGLEMVVTVDTAVAHLAAAMGKRVWIMLPYACDWRWLMDRTDTPWYPTVRLFRQTMPKRWDAVVRAIAQEIGGQKSAA